MTLSIENQQIEIVFEDSDLVVINKPAGMVVNRAESVDELTLQDWLLSRVGSRDTGLSGEGGSLFEKRGGVVHRLDKQTSGVMVMAKNEETLIALMKQFKERSVKKSYVALIHGKLVPKVGFLSLPMGRTTKDRTKFGVVVGGKMTKTDYSVEEEFTSNNSKYSDGFSLVHLYPKTGRTHQLRVVLKHLGRPIVSDDKYLGNKRLRLDIKWCPRLFLHARYLGFTHPNTNKWVEYEVGLAVDIGTALDSIKNPK